MAIYVIYPTEEHEEALQSFLEDNNISFIKDSDEVPLPQHVLYGIAR